MLPELPLHLSRSLVTASGTQVRIRHADRLSEAGPMLVVSNHRSFLDPPLLMSALGLPIRFACHRYMAQVPVLRTLISSLGGFPLEVTGPRRQSFFQRATELLRSHQPVGIFPEGAEPMVQVTCPRKLSPFHRGFAHLALRIPVRTLAIVPVAISAIEESVSPAVPLQLLNFFDPSEPLFEGPGWHPAIQYHQVNVSVGRPIWITDVHRQQYQGRRAGQFARLLTRSCEGEIQNLLREGFCQS